MSCYLNPAILHGENSREIRKNRDIATGLYVAIDRLVPDNDDNDKLRQDLNLYIDSVGQFESPAAIRARTKVAPFRHVALHLVNTIGVHMTIVQLHSKKRNCLLQQKLNDLVFIQYNTRLQRHYNLLKSNRSLDPILLRDVEENDDWLQEFADGRDGLLWSATQEAMGRNEEVGVTTRSKRKHYKDDVDDDITIEVNDLDEQLDALFDVDSEEDFMAYD
uniref:Uncharacterized protein n=1 Tax=Lactuca sativa TaxID=4236 RepID=A0A9R1V7R3_LACSA|nr:hypothetical protein LSAT_V11C600323420 [Lactuca sativa]